MNEQQNDQIKTQKPQGFSAAGDVKKDVKQAGDVKKDIKTDKEKLGGGSCGGSCN